MPRREKHDAKMSAIPYQPHDGEKTPEIRWRLTGIHLDRADARWLEDPEVWSVEVTPARRPSLDV